VDDVTLRERLWTTPTRHEPPVTDSEERRKARDMRRPPLGGSGGRLPVRLGGEEPALALGFRRRRKCVPPATGAQPWERF